MEALAAEEVVEIAVVVAEEVAVAVAVAVAVDLPVVEAGLPAEEEDHLRAAETEDSNILKHEH